MRRKTATVMLENVSAAGRGGTQTIEQALREVPGVFRASVNPATEAAYVEYDADRCTEAVLETTVASLGVHTIHRTPSRRSAATTVLPSSTPVHTSLRSVPMPDTGTRSRTWWAFVGFLAIAGFFLMTEHRAHLFGILPFLLILACPLLHVFGHSHDGHGGHGGQSRPGTERQVGEDDRGSGGHQPASSVTPEDWRN